MSKKLYITASAADNSVVLSEDMCNALKIFNGTEPHVMVFKVKDTGEYAMMRVKASMSEVTEAPIIQYNPISKHFGFACNLPTVNRIFYDMGIVAEVTTLRVKKRRIAHGKIIYVIKR